MKLYKVTATEGYETFGLLNQDWDIIDKYEGVEKITDNWGIRELRLSEKNKTSDIAYFVDMPFSMLISNEAYKCFSDILDLNDIELLAAKYEDQTYYLLHGIKAYNIHYELIQRSNGKYKVYYNKQELVEKGLNEKLFFKVKNKGGTCSDLFFTDKFVEIVNKYNLKGCDFNLEWKSNGNE